MQRIFNVNPDLCTGCRICEIVCSFQKSAEFNPFKTGIWISRDEEKGIDVPVFCRHCKNPPCVEACPVEYGKPIVKDENSGIVSINRGDQCMGCYECVRACPFGAIRIDSESKLPIKCDLCGGSPECVNWCYTGAIEFRAIGTVGEKKHYA